MGIASGAITADQGTVSINGTEIKADPNQARELGLAIVRQEPSLMPDLTVAENLFLGLEPKSRPRLTVVKDWAQELLKKWCDDVAFSEKDRVISLNAEQRFIVEIVKALSAEPRVLVLDEPTEHLTSEDVDRLFERVRMFAAGGSAVVYISHRIREVQQIADNITVLRDGKGQGSYDAKTLTEQKIIELIVGGEMDREFPPKKKGVDGDETVLDVHGLQGQAFSDVNFSLRRGEIVGLAGIIGNGQREFLRALAGLYKHTGTVKINGKKVELKNSHIAADTGINYLTDDRHREGIIGDLSVRENFSIRSLGLDAVVGFVSKRSQTNRAQAAAHFFSIKTPSIETPASSLSGGNQQKLMLSSVLASKPKILLIDEPTQGVDVGARAEIYIILRDITEAGDTPVLLVSSDAKEIAGLCDRVMIFSRGRIVQELEGDDITENNITTAALTSTHVRDRSLYQSVSALWKWAAGDQAPLVMLAVLVLLLGTFVSSISPYYLTARNMSGMLPLVATLALIAYSQQIVMLVGGIDLSVGSLMGLTVVIASFFLGEGSSFGMGLLGVAIIFLVALVVGFINWVLVDPFQLHPMAATLATNMAVLGVSLLLRPVPEGLIADTIVEGIGAHIGFIPLNLIFAIILGLVFEYMLFRSKGGIIVRGFGSHSEAARMAGVHPRLTNLFAYLGCSFFTAVAGISMIAQVGVGDPMAGGDYLIASIAAVVVGGASLFGGRGSFIGALFGAFLITQIDVVTVFLHLNQAWRWYLYGFMILVGVSIYSKSRQKAEAM
jgi:ribose transport system ATP-binding protein